MSLSDVPPSSFEVTETRPTDSLPTYRVTENPTIKKKYTVKYYCIVCIHHLYTFALFTIPLNTSRHIIPVKDHDKLDCLSQKYHPKTSLISFMTTWQHWLGMAKPKNVFRSTPNPSWKFYSLIGFSTK